MGIAWGIVGFLLAVAGAAVGLVVGRAEPTLPRPSKDCERVAFRDVPR